MADGIQRTPVHHLDPADGTDGQVPVISGGKFVIGDVSGASGGGRLVPMTTLDVDGNLIFVTTEDGSLLFSEA